MPVFRHRVALLWRLSGHPYLRTQASLHSFNGSECRAASGSWTVSSSEGFWRFFLKRNHRLVDRAMVVPLLLLCKSTRSSSVVTLLRQDVTHHLTPIDRPDWSAEALVKHAQLSIGVPNPPGFHGPVVDQFQRPECQGQKHLDQQLFKPTNQPLYMAEFGC